MLKPSALSSLRKSLVSPLAHQPKVSRRLQRAVKPVLESLEGRIQFSFTVTGAWQGLSTTENGFASGDVSHKYFGLWSTNPPDASQAQVVPDLTVAYLQGTVYSDDFGQTTYPSTLSEDSVALDPLHSQYQSDYTATGFVNQKVELFTKIDDPDLYSFFADSGSTWLGWKVNYVKETCNNSSGGPVRYNDGTAKMAFDSDFLPHADGTASTVSRSWSNGSNLNGLQPISFGNGMDLDAMPAMQRLSFIAPHSSEPGYNNDYSDRLEAYGVALSSTKTFLIMKGADGGWRSNDQQLCRKIERTSNGFKITDAQGEVLLFADSGSSWSSNQKGKLVSRTSPTGDTQSITWDSTGTLPTQIDQTYIVRSGTSSTTASDSFLFSYQTGTNQVTSITQKRNGVTVRRVGYEYYDSTDSNTADDVNGRTGDLKYVTKYDVLGTTETIVGKDYYRWYTTTTDGITQYGGYAGGLKAFLGNDSQQKALHSLGVSSLDSVSDASLVNYSDNFFQYDTRGASGKTVTGAPRVSKEVTSGTGAGCSCGKTGEGAYTFDYQSSSNPAGVNSWSAKTTETLPDGSQNIVYTNSLGDIVLKVVNDTTATKQYMTWYRYNKDGNVILQAEGKAITGIDEALPDLVGYGLTGTSTKLSDTGRIDVTNYFDAADTSDQSKFDYVKSVGYQVGQTGPVVLTESWEYVDNGVVGDGIWNVATDTTYPSEANQTVRRITSYSYDSFWQSGSVNTSQPKVLTTSYAQVSGAQNGADSTTGGSSGSYQTKTYYDSTGRVVWSVDGGGYVNYYQYDPLTGMRVKEVDDVNPTTITTAAVAGPTRDPSLPGALNLTTQYGTIDDSGNFQLKSDPQGRWTKRIDPNGNVTYKVYDDTTDDGTPRSVKTYTGWNATTHKTTGPVTAVFDDPATGIRDTVTYTYNASAGLPADSINVPTGDEWSSVNVSSIQVQSLTRALRNVSGQVVESRQYKDVTGLTYNPRSSGWAAFGTSGTNYLSTKYKYDAGGRLFQTTTPEGTVTRTIFDARGLALSRWVGTAIGTDYDAANNRVKVAEFTYDDDGNQLTVTQYPHDGSADRVTKMDYDFRDRLVATKSGLRGTSELASDNTSQITYTDYDNLDEATASYAYDGDGVTIADGDSDGVPDKPTASLLRSKMTTEYDDQGRVFASHRFSVDPSTGTVSSSSIDTNYWYDKREELIKTQTSGSAVQKMTYDGAGRMIAQYTTDGGGDSGYTDADDVTFDTVVDQINTSYDAAGNVIMTLEKRRFHDAVNPTAATAIYDLGRPTSGIRARLYYTPYWYDAANRLTAVAQIGTNFGTDYTRGNNPPARSDTKLVTSYGYDDAGRLGSTTDPRGLVNLNYYDLAGRTTKTIANYQDSLPSAADDQTTEYTYDNDSNVLTQTARLPSSAFQTTTFIYGATASRGDGLSSNDVLIATQYPDPATGSASSSQQETYKVNALGERTTFTDRNGSTHTYSYDVLGRKTLDAVTTLGTGVDGAVLAVGTSFNTQGLTEKITSYSNAAATTVANQVQRAYNGLGQVTAEYQAHSGEVDTSSTGTPKVQYGYSGLSTGNRLSSMTYPDGRQISYNYTTGLDDAVGRLSSISDSSGVLEGYKYLGMDLVVARSHPQTGVDLSYIRATGEATGDAGDQYTGLDRFNRVANQKWVNASGTIVDRSTYTYDRDGNALTKGNSLNTALSTAYTYDGLNRLASDTKNGTADQSWALDALGNSTSVTTGGTAVSRTNNSQNQLTAIGGLVQAYDRNGNQLSQSLPADFNHDGTVNFNDFAILQNNFGQSGKTQADGDADGNGTVDFNDYLALQNATGTSAPATAYAYDAWNRMVSAKSGVAGTVTTAAYAYDGLNRRIVDNGTAVYFNTAWQAVEDRNASNSTTAEYVWSRVYVDAMIERDADSDANGSLDQRLYPTQDANWNVTAVTDASGTVQARYDYTAYGSRTVLNPTTYAGMADPTGFRQGFQGGTFEAVLPNLILFRNRFYDVVTSRWLNQDPLGTAAYPTEGMNLYQFVTSNPTHFTDPTGRETADPYLPEPHQRPPGWNENWPTGTDNRGPYIQDPNSGTRWYPHYEDPRHWPHYDNDKGDRFPNNAIKPWPGQKKLKPNQCPTNPWPTPPSTADLIIAAEKAAMLAAQIAAAAAAAAAADAAQKAWENTKWFFNGPWQHLDDLLPQLPGPSLSPTPGRYPK